MDFETRAIHDGQEPDPATGAITTPIYQTSTYVQEAVGKHKGYDYARVANPTRTALEAALASLEGAEHGLAYSSGLGAVTTIMHLVDPGQRVVLIADVIGGAVVTSDAALHERLRFRQKSLGAVPGPFDAWLVLRGIKTLAVRMRQHCENARRVAEFLEGHAGVERVLYPGLASHPGHEVARRQMRDFGGMVSFLAESEEEAVAFCGPTKLFKLAESPGGGQSPVPDPPPLAHASP